MDFQQAVRILGAAASRSVSVHVGGGGAADVDELQLVPGEPWPGEAGVPSLLE